MVWCLVTTVSLLMRIGRTVERVSSSRCLLVEGRRATIFLSTKKKSVAVDGDDDDEIGRCFVLFCVIDMEEEEWW